MKQLRTAVAACVVSTLFTSVADAHEIIILVEDFTLAGGEVLELDVFVPDFGNNHVVHDVLFSGDFDNLGGNAWASDLQLSITAPDGQDVIFGGFDHLFEADEPWDFQGSGSNKAGFYTSLHARPFETPPLHNGTWRLSFTNDRADSEGMAWSDVEIRLFTGIPSAPAIGLLGAGAAASSRRRRARP